MRLRTSWLMFDASAFLVGFVVNMPARAPHPKTHKASNGRLYMLVAGLHCGIVLALVRRLPEESSALLIQTQVRVAG
jgi:hypothetical protein